jgi:hypothetical protein
MAPSLSIESGEGTAGLSLRSDDVDLEQTILDELGVRRLTGDGLVRYGQRGHVQLEQARTEALRRLQRRVLRAKLDGEEGLPRDG